MENQDLKQIARTQRMKEWFDELKKKGLFESFKDYNEWENRNQIKKEWKPKDPQEAKDFNKAFNQEGNT